MHSSTLPGKTKTPTCLSFLDEACSSINAHTVSFGSSSFHISKDSCKVPPSVEHLRDSNLAGQELAFEYDALSGHNSFYCAVFPIKLWIKDSREIT